jgi:hypothetical protein
VTDRTATDGIETFIRRREKERKVKKVDMVIVVRIPWKRIFSEKVDVTASLHLCFSVSGKTRSSPFGEAPWHWKRADAPWL